MKMEERYAMIRRAVNKVQTQQRLRRSTYKITKEAVRISNQDHTARISHDDSSSYAADNYGDVYNSTCKTNEWN